MTQLTLISD